MEIELEAGGVGIEVEIESWRGLITLAGVGLLAACVARELSRPPAERTWHGQLFGRLPYDLRPPTLERLRSTVWAPAGGQLLVPTAWGIGWSFNLGLLARRLGVVRVNGDA